VSRRVVVHRERCEGNAVCIAHAPAVFGFDDEEEKVVLLDEAPPPDLHQAVDDAVQLCPVQALGVVGS
jgi:ferredoxin